MEEGVNGCTIDKDFFDKELIINVKSHQGQLDIQFGKQVRKLYTCFKDAYFPVLSTKSFLGMTARNTDQMKDIDLNVMKVINQDPNQYRDDVEDIASRAANAKITEEPEVVNKAKESARAMAESYKADRLREEQQQIYTDDLEQDSVDIIERYENSIRRQTDFMKNSIANIGPKDSVNEMMFKMIEQTKHVNTKLADFLNSET